MILTIDIGNTQIKLGVFCWPIGTGSLVLSQSFDDWDGFEDYLKSMMKFGRGKDFDDEGGLVKPIEKVCVSSVVPELTEKLKLTLRDIGQLQPNDILFVDHQNCQLQLLVDSPKTIGADRLCNISATIKLYDSPIIIIDFGTANTYDVIDKNKNFIGGAISPGVETSGKYLIENAALLGKTDFIFPDKVVGKTTETNIQSGIMYGATSQIEGMVGKIKKETAVNDYTIVLTGGFGNVISRRLQTDHVLEEHLTLKGLFNIYEINSQK